MNTEFYRDFEIINNSFSEKMHLEPHSTDMLSPRYVDYDSRGHVFDTIAQNFSFIQFI